MACPHTRTRRRCDRIEEDRQDVRMTGAPRMTRTSTSGTSRAAATRGPRRLRAASTARSRPWISSRYSPWQASMRRCSCRPSTRSLTPTRCWRRTTATGSSRPSGWIPLTGARSAYAAGVLLYGQRPSARRVWQVVRTGSLKSPRARRSMPMPGRMISRPARCRAARWGVVPGRQLPGTYIKRSWPSSRRAVYTTPLFGPGPP